MNQEVVVPDHDATGEITLAAWLKRPGERIEAGEIIAEVLTEKVNTEIPAPVGGTVEALLVEEGETVIAGQVIARIAAT